MRCTLTPLCPDCKSYIHSDILRKCVILSEKNLTLLEMPWHFRKGSTVHTFQINNTLLSKSSRYALYTKCLGQTFAISFWHSRDSFWHYRKQIWHCQKMLWHCRKMSGLGGFAYFLTLAESRVTLRYSDVFANPGFRDLGLRQHRASSLAQD